MINLVRNQQLLRNISYSLEGIEPNQISFNQAAAFIIRELTMLPATSPGRIPEVINNLTSMPRAFVLPDRRERSYLRVVKRRPGKYEIKQCRKKCQ